MLWTLRTDGGLIDFTTPLLRTQKLNAAAGRPNMPSRTVHHVTSNLPKFNRHQEPVPSTMISLEAPSSRLRLLGPVLCRAQPPDKYSLLGESYSWERMLETKLSESYESTSKIECRSLSIEIYAGNICSSTCCV